MSTIHFQKPIGLLDATRVLVMYCARVLFFLHATISICGYSTDVSAQECILVRGKESFGRLIEYTLDLTVFSLYLATSQ